MGRFAPSREEQRWDNSTADCSWLSMNIYCPEGGVTAVPLAFGQERSRNCCTATGRSSQLHVGPAWFSAGWVQMLCSAHSGANRAVFSMFSVPKGSMSSCG